MRFKIENYYEIKNDGKKKWRKFKNTFFNNKIIQNVKGIDINQVCNKKQNNIKNWLSKINHKSVRSNPHLIFRERKISGQLIITRIGKAVQSCLTVNNLWGLLTLDEGVGFMGLFCITPFPANPYDFSIFIAILITHGLLSLKTTIYFILSLNVKSFLTTKFHLFKAWIHHLYRQIEFLHNLHFSLIRFNNRPFFIIF